MTLNKLIYSIREGVKEYTDDSELDDRYIIYLVNVARSFYVDQRLNNVNKAKKLSLQQTICVPVEVVTDEECSGNNCNVILRSVNEIPDTFMIGNMPAILRVGPTSKLERPFTFTDRFKAVYSHSSPFPKEIYSFLHDDNRLYLTSKRKGFKLLDCISITGVFEDPTDIKRFNNCCGCENPTVCFDPDKDDYPLSPELVKLVRQDVINELLNHKQIPEDKINDSND